MIKVHDLMLIITIKSAKDILDNMELINKYRKQNEIYAMIFKIEAPYKTNIDDGEYIRLYNWIENMEIPSFVMIDCEIDLSLQRFIFMCDFRIITSNVCMRLEDNYEIPNFELMTGKQYHMLIKEANKHILKNEELRSYHIVNYIMDQEDDGYRFIEKIIYNKEMNQINLIKKCFNAYRQRGLEATNEEGIREETVQFCKLVVNKYRTGC